MDEVHDEIIRKLGVKEAYKLLGIEGKLSGNCYKTNCPCHTDNNPSFAIYADSGKSYCFSSGAAYNIPGLVKTLYPNTHIPVLKELFGVEIKKHVSSTKTTLSIFENLKVDSEVIGYDEYISDSNEIDSILTNDSSYTVISQTGSGKTKSFIDSAKNLGQKIIFTVPTIPLAEQLSKDHGYPKIIGETITSDIRRYFQYKKNNIIFSTYDSLTKIFENDNFKAEDWSIIIDEAHDLVQAQSFRNRPLTKMIALSPAFRKFIKLTGTPEGTLVEDGSKLIRFKPNTPSPKNKVNIMKYNKRGLEKLTKHLLDNYYGGIVAVYIDNGKSLEAIEEALKASGRFSANEISFLTSDRKNEDDYITIIDESKLKPGTKVLLTTQVIAEGVNIYDLDVRSLYTLDNRNLIAVRQMVKRFRKSVVTVV